MATHTLDIAAFRIKYPAFSNVSKYSNAFLQQCWDVATCYIHDNDYGSLTGDCLQLALELMTAHIATVSTATNSGQSSGLVSASSVGDVSVTMTVPTIKSQLQFWLLQTPYGVQLLALLGVKGVGGIYVGGLPERTGFRKIGGTFF
jgi:hypothetical protein